MTTASRASSTKALTTTAATTGRRRHVDDRILEGPEPNWMGGNCSESAPSLSSNRGEEEEGDALHSTYSRTTSYKNARAFPRPAWGNARFSASLAQLFRYFFLLLPKEEEESSINHIIEENVNL